MKYLKLFFQRVFDFNPKSKFGKTNILALCCTSSLYAALFYGLFLTSFHNTILVVILMLFGICAFPILLLLGEIVILMIIDNNQNPNQSGYINTPWKRIFTMLFWGIWNLTKQTIKTITKKLWYKYLEYCRAYWCSLQEFFFFCKSKRGVLLPISLRGLLYF